MSHHRYQTSAFVLGSTASGEANRFIDLFTEELGRIHAVARSVREERSKLRFSLQQFTLANVSLVRGKDVWRIIGAEPRENFHFDLKERPREYETMARLTSLLKRLLYGEEANPELFSAFIHEVSFVRDVALNEEELGNFECLVVLRILYNLGYVARNDTNARFLDTARVDTDLVAHLTPLRFDMIKQINASLQESQM